ncbi:cupin domain-containing protein [Xylanibacter caecicola]|uniref:cupin domain-containing protein n=1 Tax=Xylanibacter caecicola TaxID=2736294 RepID=UPI0025864521|nr:cupin domain-containing protein [Xylanibacter caecicola]
MNELKKTNEGNGYAHGMAGSITDFEGKAFARDVLGLTSCEVSVGTLDAGQAVPFFHSHKENEEIYIILSGKGAFQVDGEVFPVAEGSIVRVATGRDRNIRNTSAAGKMTYLCIQAREGSLRGCTMDDAEITQREALL